MSKLANLFLKIGESIANSRSSIYHITIDNADLTVKFAKPQTTDEKFYEKVYRNAVIYAKGYANPIKFKPENIDSDKEDFIPTTKYKTFMNQRVIQSGFSRGGDFMPEIKRLFYAILIAVGIVALFVIGSNL